MKESKKRTIKIPEDLNTLKLQRVPEQIRKIHGAAPADPQTPLELAEKHERRAIILNSLKFLSELQKKIVRFVLDFGYTISEICGVLKKPYSTVRYNLKKAIARIRRELKEWYRSDGILIAG